MRRTEKSASSEQISRIGDVIIPTSGETPEEIATASCVMLPGVILAGDLNIFRTNTVDGRLISYIIRHVINKKISCVAQGKSVVHVKADELSKISVRYPGSAEQHKLLSFLALLQSRIAVQRRLVEALKSYKRGVTKAIFNPNSVYQNCAESWRLRKVSELLSYEQPQKYIVQTEHYSSNYATPVLTANKGFILGYTNETTGVYDKGDVVIYDDFTMDMKYVDFPFKVKSSTIKFLTAKPGNNLYFLFCLLQSLSLTPEGHQRSYISKVEQMNVFVPSVDEQSRIAGILKKVTVILERHEFALHKLEMLKAGLLNQLFI